MVLHVEFLHLAEEARRYELKPWVYLSSTGGRSIATMGDARSNTLLQAETNAGFESAQTQLTDQGLLVAHGRWLPDPFAGELQIQEQLWVASIAYRSYEEKPGLWIHAYRGTPSVGDAIKDFYEEMCRESDLDGVSLDEFVESVLPNVVILGPNEMASFADTPKQGPIDATLVSGTE